MDHETTGKSAEEFTPPTAAHVYTISQVGAMLGDVPVETLRHWEKDLGNLLQPMRQAGGARRFSDADVRTLRMFVDLKSRGFTNEGARRELVLGIADCQDIQTVEQALLTIDRATRSIAQAAARLDDAREFLQRHTRNKE